jgi:hypothetical protein
MKLIIGYFMLIWTEHYSSKVRVVRVSFIDERLKMIVGKDKSR